MPPETTPTSHSAGTSRLGLKASALLGLLALLSGLAWGARSGLETRIIEEATDLAAAAGLELTIGGLSVSPTGRLEIRQLEARREDGSKAVRIGAIVASWHLLDLLRGRKMPAELTLDHPAAEVRLVDGRPVELQRWLRAARGRLGGKTGQRGGSGATVRWRGPDRLRIDGGVFRLQPTASLAKQLPGGVLLRDLNVALDRERGGKVSGHLEAPVDAALGGTVHVDERGGLWLATAFDPPLTLPLPPSVAERLGATVVSVGGIGWSPADGPHLTQLRIGSGRDTVLAVARLAFASAGDVRLRADGLVLGLRPDQNTVLGRLLGQLVGSTTVAAGRLEIGSLTGTRLRGLGGARRVELQARDLVAELPGGLGVATAESVSVGLPRSSTAAFDPAQATLRVRGPRLMIRAPQSGGPAWLRPLRRLGELIETERSRPLASVLAADARLGAGWQRPGTVSVRQRRAQRRRKTKEQLRVERLAKRRKRREGQQAMRKEGAYTRRFAAPLRRLRQQLTGLAVTMRGVGGPGLARLPTVRVLGGELQVEGKGWQLGLADMRADWRRLQGGANALVVAGELRSGSLNLGRWRVRADLTEAQRMGPLRLQLEGGELARIGRALWPNLGVGQQPQLQVDLTLMAGEGRALLRVDGSVSSRGIGLDWRRFSPVPHTDFPLDATFALQMGAGKRAALRFDAPDVRLADAVFALQATVAGEPREPTVDLRLEMPKQDCGRVARSIPSSLLPTIGTLKAQGEIAWWLTLHLNLLHPYFSQLDLGLDDKRCEVESFGDIDLRELAGDFSRKVNEDGFVLDRVRIGPRSGAWTPIAHMPRWLPYAMMTTEDGSFYSHRGLNPFLLNRAIRLDLHYGRFVYGGSTLTQQLVKNLYMTRSKYLGRKLEELLIVWHMERTLPKTRILEIYTNGVEFGPGKYGVTRGARHYFDKSPSQITPLEAAWLGSIKPCPACADGHFRAKRYGIWYQKRLLEILTRMHYYGVISQDQYDREMNTVPRFTGWPAGKLARRFDLPIPPRKVNKIDLGKRAAEEDEETLQAEAAERREKMRLRLVAREERMRAMAAERRAKGRAREELKLQRLEQRRLRLKARKSAALSARERRELARIKRKMAAGKVNKAALAAAKRRAAERSWEERQRQAIAAERARLSGKTTSRRKTTKKRRKRRRPPRKKSRGGN